MARILSVDLGEKRVGLALSDPQERIATGLPTRNVTGLKDAVRQVAAEAAAWGAARLVVGLPLSLDGSEGPAAARAREFARRLAESARVPVELLDERFTTAEAARALRGTRAGRDRAAGAFDEGAAILLLQSYLDAARMRREREEKAGGSGASESSGGDDAPAGGQGASGAEGPA